MSYSFYLYNENSAKERAPCKSFAKAEVRSLLTIRIPSMPQFSKISASFFPPNSSGSFFLYILAFMFQQLIFILINVGSSRLSLFSIGGLTGVSSANSSSSDSTSSKASNDVGFCPKHYFFIFDGFYGIIVRFYSLKIYFQVCSVSICFTLLGNFVFFK